MLTALNYVYQAGIYIQKFFTETSIMRLYKGNGVPTNIRWTMVDTNAYKNTKTSLQAVDILGFKYRQ
jgi:hypothetical protein